ncbi:MAG: endolytic transglycosylase MltG [Pseudomonadota bacterium]
MSDEAAKRGLTFVLGFFVYGFTTLVVVLALSFWWAASQFQAPGPLQETKLITIERGTGLNAIAQQLSDKGAVKSPYIFIFGARILGAQSSLKAGEYELQPGMSAKDIMITLRDHEVFARRFTIREGLTSYEVVRHLKTIENLSGEVDAIPAEGILLPNTYDYQLGEERAEILKRLENEMEKVLLPACKVLLEREAGTTLEDFLDMDCPSAPAPLKTLKDVLTLASIIEKETGQSDERAKVAGVFLNRLNKGIALQTDPTVIYAINKGRHENKGKGPLGRRLLRTDLQYDSPYNTYKYPGLPPGPIANPGKASIEAVLSPASHDYIFFVADGTGGHAFAKTLKEHNANVAKWRKIRRAQGN